MKQRHRLKRQRDRKKRDQKLLNKVDVIVLTKHAVARASERSVSVRDIKKTLKKGKVEQTSSKTFRISADNTVVVVAKNKKNKTEDTPLHLAVLTTWKTSRKKKKKQKKV